MGRVRGNYRVPPLNAWVRAKPPISLSVTVNPYKAGLPLFTAAGACVSVSVFCAHLANDLAIADPSRCTSAAESAPGVHGCQRGAPLFTAGACVSVFRAHCDCGIYGGETLPQYVPWRAMMVVQQLPI